MQLSLASLLINYATKEHSTDCDKEVALRYVTCIGGSQCDNGDDCSKSISIGGVVKQLRTWVISSLMQRMNSTRILILYCMENEIVFVLHFTKCLAALLYCVGETFKMNCYWPRSLLSGVE